MGRGLLLLGEGAAAHPFEFRFLFVTQQSADIFERLVFDVPHLQHQSG